MKLKDGLDPEAIKNLNAIKLKKYSNKYWMDMMGANKDTFKRVKGAIRRR